jgi:exopolysaccharide biosynthesis protein
LKRKLTVLTLVLLLVALGTCGWIWQRNGAYGFNVLFRRGGTYWIHVKSDDPRLSPSMRLALRNPPSVAAPETLDWKEIDTGFEVAELPVMANGGEVDRIVLNRIDPARFRFVVRNAADGTMGLDEWEHALPKAVLIVNGSYYDLKGKPATPFISEGEILGPRSYDARAGAFVAGKNTAGIRDLSQQDWQDAFAGAANAMVSYPLLIGDDGQTHVSVKSRWLANRTFVGQDRLGRIVIGTTKEAFFSLDRLAEFLQSSPLELATALNLDGGPIACQSVRLNGVHRKTYAHWEAQVNGNQVRLLRWPFAEATWAMPVVLTVERQQ